MTPYDKDDAAKDTGSSVGEVSEAWHGARDDAEKSGDLDRGSDKGSGGHRDSDRGRDSDRSSRR